MAKIREAVRKRGQPYCSELTYKHAYHWEKGFKEKWNAWRDNGFEGSEPEPEFKKFFYSAIEGTAPWEQK
jgi:hypothetical protein